MRSWTQLALPVLFGVAIQGSPVLAQMVELELEATPAGTPTLNAVAVASDGTAIAVGNDRTILRRASSEGVPVWEALPDVAATFFAAADDIFDVQATPLGAGGTSAQLWAISGRDAVIETDLNGDDRTLVDTSGEGNPFTPVLPTTQEVWYALPNFEVGGFSIIGRYNRAAGSAAGIVTLPNLPVLAMCQTSDSNVVRYITTGADIVDIEDDLTQTYVLDREPPLDLTAAGFNEACDLVSAGNRLSDPRTSGVSQVSEVEQHRQMIWIIHGNGGSTEIFGASVSAPGYTTIAFPVEESSGPLRSNIVAFLEDRGVELFVFDFEILLLLGAMDGALTVMDFSYLPRSFAPEQHEVADVDEIIAVGLDGLAARGTIDFFLFRDGFESGSASAWTATVP